MTYLLHKTHHCAQSGVITKLLLTCDPLQQRFTDCCKQQQDALLQRSSKARLRQQCRTDLEQEQLFGESVFYRQTLAQPAALMVPICRLICDLMFVVLCHPSSDLDDWSCQSDC